MFGNILLCSHCVVNLLCRFAHAGPRDRTRWSFNDSGVCCLHQNQACWALGFHEWSSCFCSFSQSNIFNCLGVPQNEWKWIKSSAHN